MSMENGRQDDAMPMRGIQDQDGQTPILNQVQRKAKRRESQPITLANIEAQLRYVSWCPLTIGTAVSGGLIKGLRHDDCFLTWPAEMDTSTAADTLGPYARWLTAARVLMHAYIE